MSTKTFLLGTLAFLVLVLCFFGKDNVFAWIRAGRVIHRQNLRIEELQQKNAELDRRIDVMSSNPDTLEKYARETFCLKEAGEDVYVFYE